LVVAGFIMLSGVAACDRASSTHADARPVEPDAATAPAAPAADIPLGESTRSASLPDSYASAQGGNSTLQADATPRSAAKAAAPATDADPDAEKTPALSAEQQELAAEVGDTRHAGAQMSADRTSSDKASPDKSPS
jgi:hypothetical protein